MGFHGLAFRIGKHFWTSGEKGKKFSMGAKLFPSENQAVWLEAIGSLYQRNWRNKSKG